MFKNPLLIVAIAMTVGVSIWGIIDTPGLTRFAENYVEIGFKSRGWFIMLTASIMLIGSICLAVSKYGRVKLGKENEEPEFSTISWMAMMFAAGMGVGLLFYGAAEPISHYLFINGSGVGVEKAASTAMLLTNFHWGLHAWAIYGLTGLVIAYFGFCRGTPQLISAPIVSVFGKGRFPRSIGWLVDLLSIYAIAIGLAGSVAMGVFQVQDGMAALFNTDLSGIRNATIIFGILFAVYMVPLTMDLSRGMSMLSNIAVGIAVCLMAYLLIIGPTSFLMNGIIGSIGQYFSKVIPHGFATYTFYDPEVKGWFRDWSLNYMVWWLAWAPFVGVFIARISRGRTIREFLAGVLIAPTFFSIFWFGIFGGMGFFQGAAKRIDPAIVESNINQTTFILLDTLPLSTITISATIIAAFLFIVTSVVSAAYVLSMFSEGGSQNPAVKMKLIWGLILGTLGFAMILSNSVGAVRQIIAMSAGPFVFIVLLLLVCLLKALKKDEGETDG